MSAAANRCRSSCGSVSTRRGYGRRETLQRHGNGGGTTSERRGRPGPILKPALLLEHIARPLQEQRPEDVLLELHASIFPRKMSRSKQMPFKLRKRKHPGGTTTLAAPWERGGGTTSERRGRPGPILNSAPSSRVNGCPGAPALRAGPSDAHQGCPARKLATEPRCGWRSSNVSTCTRLYADGIKHGSKS